MSTRFSEGKGIAGYGEVFAEAKGFDEFMKTSLPRANPRAVTVDDLAALREKFPDVPAEVERMSELLLGKILRILAHALPPPIEMHPAGDVLNVLRNIERLGSAEGARCEVRFAGPLGGGRLRESMESRLGVPFLASRGEEGGIGIGVIGVDAHKKMYAFIDSEKAAVRDALSEEVSRRRIAEASREMGALYTSLIALGMTRRAEDFISLLRESRQAGALVAFDTNYRPPVMKEYFRSSNRMTEAEAFEAVSRETDVLLAGREDLGHLYGPQNVKEPGQIYAFMKAIRKNVAHVVVKADADGVYWLDDDGVLEHLPSSARSVADTTGAGDGFNAALLFALRAGKDLGGAVECANEAAAGIVESMGPDMPSCVVERVRERARG